MILSFSMMVIKRATLSRIFFSNCDLLHLIFAEFMHNRRDVLPIRPTDMHHEVWVLDLHRWSSKSSSYLIVCKRISWKFSRPPRKDDSVVPREYPKNCEKKSSNLLLYSPTLWESGIGLALQWFASQTNHPISSAYWLFYCWNLVFGTPCSC